MGNHGIICHFRDYALNLSIVATWLGALHIGNVHVTVSGFKCDFKWKGNKLAADYIGSRIDEGSCYDCPAGKPGGQCVSLVKCLCGLGGTYKWRPGLRVKDNCDAIPLNTPIAIFTGADGRYVSGKDHAAIFRGCFGGLFILVLEQYCGSPIRWNWYHKGNRYYENFYTITCNGNDCTKHPISKCILRSKHK